jgi:ABC-type uncharacterized transport system
MAGLSERRGAGWLARLGIGSQVLLAGALALAAVLMINWLAGRPGVRQRFDLTAGETNTLSTASMGVLKRLPGEVTIDTFFREEPGPLRQVGWQAVGRTQRLLGLFRDLSSGNVRVRHNNMADSTLIEQRKRDLKLRGIENCLIVSYGDTREVVPLIGGLAQFDPGRPPPDYVPPRIVEFGAEKAICQALLTVTRGEDLEVYFLTGHGELDAYDREQYGLDKLTGLLGDEGLRVSRWNPNEDGAFPENVACLSIIQPEDPLADGTLDAIEAYVRGGGRLVVAPSPDDDALERSRINELLARFDLEVQAGVVCQPRVDPNTGAPSVGHPAVGILAINPARMARHPLVDPFRLQGRTFAMSLAHPVRLTGQPPRGVSSPLFTSEVRAWVDSSPFDWTPNEQYELCQGPFPLAIASQFRPEDAPQVAGLEQEIEARIVLVGGAFAFSNAVFQQNHDFLRNTYNWVLDREFRLSISARPTDLRFWPQDRLDRLPKLNQLAWGWLPGLCLLLGFLTAFLRSRGGPRSKSST